MKPTQADRAPDPGLLRVRAPWTFDPNDVMPPRPPKAAEDRLATLVQLLGIKNTPGYRIETVPGSKAVRGYGALAIPMPESGAGSVLRSPLGEFPSVSKLREAAANSLIDQITALEHRLPPAKEVKNPYPFAVEGDDFIGALVTSCLRLGFDLPTFEIRHRSNARPIHTVAYVYVPGRRFALASDEVPFRASSRTDLRFTQIFGPVNDTAQAMLTRLATDYLDDHGSLRKLSLLAEDAVHIIRNPDGSPDYIGTLRMLSRYGLDVREEIEPLTDGAVGCTRRIVTRSGALVFEARADGWNRLEATTLASKGLIDQVPWITPLPIDPLNAGSTYQFEELYRYHRGTDWWPIVYEYRPGFSVLISIRRLYFWGSPMSSPVPAENAVADSADEAVEPVASRLSYPTSPVPRTDYATSTKATSSERNALGSRTLPITSYLLRHNDEVEIGSLHPALAAFLRMYRRERATQIGESGGSGDERFAVVGGAVFASIVSGRLKDIDLNGLHPLDPFVRHTEGYLHRTAASPPPTLPLPLVNEIPASLSTWNASSRKRLAPLSVLLEHDREDRPHMVGRWTHHGTTYEIEQAASNVITPEGIVLRYHPILSICTFALTDRLRFLDFWGGVEDLSEGRARMVGPLERLSLKNLLVCLRHKLVKRLDWDPATEERLAVAGKQLAVTIEQISMHGFGRSKALAERETMKELSLLYRTSSAEVVDRELERWELRSRIQELLPLLGDAPSERRSLETIAAAANA